MRSILAAGLVLMFVAVPAAQAQQFVPPVEVDPVQSSLVEAPPQLSQGESASVQPVEASETAAAAAMQEPSARTLLAVVGAVVLIVALIALLR
jgi:hypothetical protein